MPGREADHSPPSSAVVKKVLVRQYTFMTWCLVKTQGSLYLMKNCEFKFYLRCEGKYVFVWY
jgi:hypothetical protein